MATSSLSVLEKLDLIPALLQCVGVALYAALLAPFRGSSGPTTFNKHVIFTVTRSILARLSPEQLQYLMGSDKANYLAYTAQNSLPSQVVAIPNGTSAFWFGSPSASRVLVWIHGGGFVLPLGHHQMAFVTSLGALYSTPSNPAAVFLPSYTLCPAGRYPRQLSEIVAALRYLIHDLGKSPSNIILGGDSAGASLALGALSHITHPHPEIAPLELTEKLKAMAMLGPWLSMKLEADSFRRNDQRDMASKPYLKRWRDAYLGWRAADHYSQPTTVPVEWWDGLMVGEVLIVCGEDEVLLDDTLMCGEKIKKAHPQTTLVVASGECHIAPMLPPVAVGEEVEQSRTLKAWMKARALE